MISPSTVTRMTRRALCDFLVASCVSDGGVNRYRLFEDGSVETLQTIPMDRPMFMQEQDGVLHTVLRAPFEGSDESGYACFDLRSGDQLGSVASTRGVVACHLTCIGEDAYAANYVSGSVIRLPDVLVTHEGASVHPTRQTSPHAHGAFLSPDGRYVLVCDLGLDRIFVYTRELALVSSVALPAGVGPRHLCFSACGGYVYCLNEMGGSICILSWQNGVLTLLETVSVLPDGHVGDGAGAAIRLSADGRFLFVTERATERIVTLSVDGAHLQVLSSVACGGKEPRDLLLVAEGRVAICANQFGNSVSIFQIGADGVLTPWTSFALDAPICIVEL